MSIPPVVYREPLQADVTTAEFLVYRCFIEHLQSPTSPVRAVLRASRDCGLSRRRVTEIVRKVNADVLDTVA